MSKVFWYIEQRPKYCVVVLNGLRLSDFVHRNTEYIGTFTNFDDCKRIVTEYLADKETSYNNFYESIGSNSRIKFVFQP